VSTETQQTDFAGQTVFALSTAPGRAALAVIRLTGAQALAALQGLGVTAMPPARQASLRKLYEPKTGTLLDEALVLYFAAPHSFTGEDMLELHIHGGVACTQSVLAALADIETLSPAAPGDFTRRAVMNGRMDLTGAEAIADLIDAEGRAQQQQALQQMQGGLRDLMLGWREQLKTVLAHLEADLEFADEDLPGGLGRTALGGVPTLIDAMQAHLADTRGVQLRDGVRVALLGPPNAGKSSILNALAGKEAAIVSARAGTTRDVIEVAMVMAGVPVTLVDTAGLRAAGDDIEREGVRRALRQAEEADLRIWVSAPDVSTADLGEAEAAIGPQDLLVYNKLDIAPAPSDVDFALSTKTGDGVDDFLAALEARMHAHYAQREAPVLTRRRHADALAEALDALQRAETIADTGLELAAEDLRLASRALGRITGAVDVEALLDIVFADFCIGK
jgi:tRNA modification GTPase